MMHWLRDHMEREHRWSYPAVPTYNGALAYVRLGGPGRSRPGSEADVSANRECPSPQGRRATMCGAQFDHSRSDWAESRRLGHRAAEGVPVVLSRGIDEDAGVDRRSRSCMRSEKACDRQCGREDRGMPKTALQTGTEFEPVHVGPFTTIDHGRRGVREKVRPS